MFINDDSSSTIGVDYAVLYRTFNNNKLKIHLWDTAGQERFHSIIKNYFKNTSSAILFFDLNNESSFNSIDSWIKEYKNMNICDHDHPIILIGNKNDLKINVSYEKIKNIVIKYNLIYHQTSIKDSNIDIMFNTLIELIYNEVILKNIKCSGITNINNHQETKLDKKINKKIKCCI